jgi:hypothetical protein
MQMRKTLQTNSLLVNSAKVLISTSTSRICWSTNRLDQGQALLYTKVLTKRWMLQSKSFGFNNLTQMSLIQPKTTKCNKAWKNFKERLQHCTRSDIPILFSLLVHVQIRGISWSWLNSVLEGVCSLCSTKNDPLLCRWNKSIGWHWTLRKEWITCILRNLQFFTEIWNHWTC